MDDIIKKLIKDDSEKLIIMDSGKPRFVVMSYEQYVKLTEINNINKDSGINFEESFPRLDLTQERPVIEVERSEISAMIEDREKLNDLSLDDLPIV